jgi:iron complex transport system substrate-binding protein
MKIAKYLFAAGLIILVFLSVSSGLDEQKIEIVDYIGRTVEVPDNIDSIVSLDPDSTRILVALGAGENITGVEKTAQSCPVLRKVFPQVESLPGVGGIAQGTLSLEKLAELKPDVVFLRGLYPETAEKIQGELGIPCVCTLDSGKKVNDFLKSVQVIGKTVNKESRAEELVALIGGEMGRINTTVSTIPNDQRKRTLYIGPPFTKDILRVIYNPHLCVYTAGGINVAYTSDNISAGVGPWQTVSLEQVAGWNPDMIFIHGLSLLNPEDVLDSPDWKDLKAVKDHKVYKVFAVSTGYDPAMLVMGTMQMAKIMYPDKFDFDFQVWAEQICQGIYGGEGLPAYMESEYRISEV